MPPPPPPSIPSSKKILMTFPLPYLRLFEVGALSRLSSERAYKIFTIFSYIFSASLLSINKTKKKNTVLTLYRVFTIFSFFLVWGVLRGGGGEWLLEDGRLLTFGHPGGRSFEQTRYVYKLFLKIYFDNSENFRKFFNYFFKKSSKNCQTFSETLFI